MIYLCSCITYHYFYFHHIDDFLANPKNSSDTYIMDHGDCYDTLLYYHHKDAHFYVKTFKEDEVRISNVNVLETLNRIYLSKILDSIF